MGSLRQYNLQNEIPFPRCIDSLVWSHIIAHILPLHLGRHYWRYQALKDMERSSEVRAVPLKDCTNVLVLRAIFIQNEKIKQPSMSASAVFAGAGSGSSPGP